MGSWEDIQAWIDAAKGGDRRAFDKLVVQYTDVVASFIQAQLGKHLRQKVEVEDLVQETFLRAFQSIGGFRGETEAVFRSWLTTIAEHVVQDQARRLKGGKGQERSLDERFPFDSGDSVDFEALLAHEGPSPSKMARQNERFDRLKRVLGTLRPDHAKVIVLTRIQGLPIKEVARRMNRTPEATSMLLMRALLKLKAAFGATDSFHLPERSLEEEIGENHGE